MIFRNGWLGLTVSTVAPVIKTHKTIKTY